MSYQGLKALVESLVEQELDEMPIANYKQIGDFTKGSSFRHAVDRRLLSHPKAIEKIHRQWENTPYEFDIYVMNDKRVNSPDFREIGSVSLSFVRNKMMLTPEEFPDPRPGVITIIFTNNVGDQRYMASGWILAHRFGHALAMNARFPGDGVGKEWQEFVKELRTIFADILQTVYGVNVLMLKDGERDKVLRHAAHQLGSMKSARDKNLRSWWEFAYELLAQYMLTGSIKLNPLPQSLIVGYGGWGRKQTRNVQSPESQAMYNNHDLEYYARGLEQYLENVLDRAQGRIFVM